jgi:tRNA1(Val) A37 N6-methylase TrmN6
MSVVDLGAGSAYLPLQARYEKELRKVEIQPETAYLSFSEIVAPEGTPQEGNTSESAIF